MKQLLKHILCSLALFSSLCAATGGAGTASTAESASVDGIFPLGNPLTYNQGDRTILVDKTKFRGGLEKYLGDQLKGIDSVDAEPHETAGVPVSEASSEKDSSRTPASALMRMRANDFIEKLTGLTEVTAVPLSSAVNILRLGYAYILKGNPEYGTNMLVQLIDDLNKVTVKGFLKPLTHTQSFEAVQLMLFATAEILAVNPESDTAAVSLLTLENSIISGIKGTGLTPEEFLLKIQSKL